VTSGRQAIEISPFCLQGDLIVMHAHPQRARLEGEA